MDECDSCGELKKVRKEISREGKHLKIKIPLFLCGDNSYHYDYICEDCDKAQKIINKKDKEENLKKKIEKQKAWVKQRDKILKEDSK